MDRDLWRQPGCLLGQNKRTATNNPKILKTTGNNHLDAYYNVEHQIVKVLFGVAPDFAFFEDSSPNAFATRDRLIGSSAFGSILYGINLIRVTRDALGDTPLVGIIAHESAHIFQYYTNFPISLGKIPELHADFLAGWYLGRKKVAGNLNIDGQAFAISLYNLGDFSFNHPSHHGTPEERVNAMTSGFWYAHQNPMVTAARAAQFGAKVLGIR